jgi:VWFA-related protein
MKTKLIAVVFALIMASAVSAQQTLPDGPKPQNNVPAPSQSLPTTSPIAPPPSASEPAASDQPTTQPPAPQPATQPSQQPDLNTDTTFPGDRPPAKKPDIRTVPPGGETKGPGGHTDDLPIISKSVNFVMVPVSVKDGSGRPVYGLAKDNFSILENGVKQPLKYFTSDPFAISAAIVIDVGLPDIALKKVQETFNALIGAFSEYDEVAIYTFSDNIKQRQDFASALGERTATTLRQIRVQQGRSGGASTVEGPMVSGPTVNGQVFNPGDPSQQHTTSVANIEPPHTLNDAILRAAIDLSRRPRERRKVIFIISDGREDRSSASYNDVLKVLLSNEVQVYALGVDSAAMPAYSKLSKVRLPRQPYGNILPKYANATGGELVKGFGEMAIEQAYAKLMDDARNQYTIGYTSPATLSTAYRNIEVRVSADTSVKVYARDGYYPLPPTRK